MVFLGLSGGGDSSGAALLLKEKGYEVIGVFMRCFNLDGCAERDAEDARRVAGHLRISFYVWDFEEEYKQRVVDYMIEGYRRGETPNPDVMCNKEIKFGLFLEKALRMGADYVATGHYVKLVVSSGVVSSNEKAQKKKLQTTHYKLLTAHDGGKDQSYFLWTLTQEQLAHCLFPIGDYLKSEVREMARQAGLATADKKDSQGICFLGRVRLDEFLGKYIKPKLGQIRLRESDGSYKTLGEHHGAHFYTIGQRRGIGLGGGTPYYVAEKDVKTNTLVVARSKTDRSLYRKEIELTDVNFINPRLMTNDKIQVLARVRYRQPLSPALLVIGNKSLVPSHKLIFERPQKFVAPGQSAVFYSEDGDMLGGGIIIEEK